jgi:hypothetical protein
MKVSGQHHTLAALLRERRLMTIEEEVGQSPELIFTIWRREISRSIADTMLEQLILVLTKTPGRHRNFLTG